MGGGARQETAVGSHKKRIWDLKHKIPFDFPSSERGFWDRVTTGGPKGQVQRWVQPQANPTPTSLLWEVLWKTGKKQLKNSLSLICFGTKRLRFIQDPELLVLQK